jgi:hypothetical protein
MIISIFMSSLNVSEAWTSPIDFHIKKESLGLKESAMVHGIDKGFQPAEIPAVKIDDDPREVF